MSASALMQATQSLVDLLNPLSSEEQQRVIKAAFALLGETSSSAMLATAGPEAPLNDEAHIVAPAKAKLWMKQNEIGTQILEQVFHVEEKQASFIAGEVPGKSSKEKTVNAYVVAGLEGLLATGEAKFTDKRARELCTNLGCYDQNNHGTYMKAKGNNFTGDKAKGWTLTAPGLKAAAKIVQDLTKEKD